ncbi:MAG: isochorismatase family protein [Clostridia bacterium]|nr:isochorismatase family protein [Clostridia bacterium]
MIVDVQKGVFKFKQPVYNEDILVSNLKQVINSAKRKNIKIIYVQHENDSFLKKGSEEWEIIDDIKPITDENHIFHKKFPSAFKETDLLDYLKQEGVDKIYVAGLISNGCVKETCLDGLNKHFEIVLISDAHSTFYKDADKIIHETNEEMESKGATLQKCSELW